MRQRIQQLAVDKIQNFIRLHMGAIRTHAHHVLMYLDSTGHFLTGIPDEEEKYDSSVERLRMHLRSASLEQIVPG